MSFLESFFAFVRQFQTPQPGPGDDNRSPEPPPSKLSVDGAGWILDPVVTRRAELHAGRMGKRISPWAITAHTTDMHPDSFEALVKKSQRDAGAGSGWHFLIGRHPAQGVVQSAPIYRNANHAGGGIDPATKKARPHGWLRDARGSTYHPNNACVGIEVHCGGLLTRIDGKWRTVSGGKASGAPIPVEDVTPISASRGWHRPTPYQVARFHELCDVLAGVMSPPPTLKVVAVPSGTPPAWVAKARQAVLYVSPSGDALPMLPPIFGHVDLDPARKTDPGPELVQQIALRGW